MANQKRNRLLALALALCLALGMLLPAGQVNAEGRSAGILTEVTGQEREQLASLAKGAMMSSIEQFRAFANCCMVFAEQRSRLLRPAHISRIVVLGTPLILES